MARLIPFLLLALSPAAPLAAQEARDTLSDSAVTLNPIVVTAERRATPLSGATSAVRLITRAEITRRGATDLTTLLRDLPGVQLDPVVGSGAGVSLQGLGSDRVLVLLDGAPVAGRISGEFDLTRFDPALFERIEIVDGPQSTLYGSSALGGVVNLLTRRDTSRRVELSSQMGAFGQRDVRGRLQGTAGGLRGSVDLGRRAVDVVPGHGGGTTGFAERWDAMLHLGGARPVAPDLRLLWVGENQFYQTSTRYNFNDNWQLDGLARLPLDARRRTELRLHGSAYDHRFVASSTPRIADGRPEWDKQRVADAELVHHGALGRHGWLAGAKVEREWLSTPRIQTGERAAWSGAAYASVDWVLSPRLQLVTGSRVTSSEVWGTAVAPRIAVLVRGVGPLYARTAVARGFRAPSFKEQYMNYLNPQARYAVRGNEALEPEHSWNVSGEIGAGGSASRVYVRGFTNRLRDFIETELVGDSGGIRLFEYRNVGRARTAGVELGASLTRGPLEAGASYAYLDTEDQSSGTELLGRAAHTARGALGLVGERFAARTEVIYTSRVPLSRSGGDTRYQDAYARVNARVSAAPLSALQITLGVDNLGDTVPAGAVGEIGRRWFAGLTWGAAW